VSLSLNYQFVDQNKLWNGTSAASEPILSHGIIEQETRSRTMVSGVRAQISRSFAMSASLPYILDRMHRHAFEHHPGYFISSQWQYSGLGDLTLLGDWSPALALPGHATLMVHGGSKLPTGKRHVEEVLGEEPEPVDWLGGFQVSLPVPTRTFTGEVLNQPLAFSAMARANGVGTEDYKMGNEVMANLSGGYALWHALSAMAQLNFHAHGRDQAGQTDADPHHTGAVSLHFSPGLQLKVTPLLAIYGYGQIRLYEHTNGPQLVGPFHLVLGSTYAIGL
jgi:hypothetical protein